MLWYDFQFNFSLSQKIMKNFDIAVLRFRIVLLVLISLVFLKSVSANEASIKPFIKGSFQQIQLEHKERPTIITFWSESCAFCMKELALLGRLIKNYPQVEIVSITTDPFLDGQTVRQILSSKNLQNVQKWVFADDYVEPLYFDVDHNWRGELPLTYFIDRKNNMIKHLGVIKEDELIDWLAEQVKKDEL